MSTALDLIASSLRLIDVVAAGEPVPLDMANDSLMVMNDMIDSWNADRLAIYTTRSDDYNYQANKQSYTLGAGGDFNMARPPQIDAMSTIIENNPTNPVELPIALYTVEDWQKKVPVKTVSGTIPLLCYDDGGFPFRTLSFWPIPSDPTNKVRIYSWQALAAQTLTAQVTMPPGYRQAYRYNLAVLLAAEFSAPVPAIVAQIANESLGRVKILNAPDLEISSDLVNDPAGYNFAADWFGLPYGAQ